MKRMIYLGILFGLLLTVNTTATAGEKLTIPGTGDSQALLRKLADLYEKKNPGVDIVIPESTGSGGGIKAVIKGTAELARTARPMKERERVHDLMETRFALSPIVMATNPKTVIIKDISIEEILGIYSGAITHWSGNGHKIYPVDREAGDSSRKVLEKNLATGNTGFKDIQSKGKVFYSTPETADALAKNGYTIGYLPMSMANEYGLNILSINSIYPSETNVNNYSYKWVTPFFLVKSPNASKLANDFIRFIQTPDAYELMLVSGVVPVK